MTTARISINGLDFTLGSDGYPQFVAEILYKMADSVELKHSIARINYPILLLNSFYEADITVRFQDEVMADYEYFIDRKGNIKAYEVKEDKRVLFFDGTVAEFVKKYFYKDADIFTNDDFIALTEKSLKQVAQVYALESLKYKNDNPNKKIYIDKVFKLIKLLSSK